MKAKDINIKNRTYYFFNDLIFNKVNGYFKEINGNKYLTPVTTNKIK